MVITHKDLAIITNGLYVTDLSINYIYKSNLDANVYMGMIIKDDVLIVSCRGSFDEEDWLHDLRFHKFVPPGNNYLGEVHDGMYLGTPEALDIIKFIVNINGIKKIIFCGHSLGGARASLLAAQWTFAEITEQVAALVTWGEPASMLTKGNSYISDIPGANYRNKDKYGIDTVTESTKLFGFVPRKQFDDISNPPLKRNLLDLFDLHHFELYMNATPATEIVI
jgi:pimeloyl-ACP methyl ester carboxylesterase